MEILYSLLPYIIASALVPIEITFNILILNNPQKGVLKSLAFVAGMTTLRLLQGVIFGLILFNSAAASAGPGGNGPVVLTLKLVLGILLLNNAYKKFRKEPDPDAPPPKWLTMVESVSLLNAFVMGFGIVAINPKLWVFTLGVISEIAEAQLGQPSSTSAFLLFILLAQSLLLLPLLLKVIFPQKSVQLLSRISEWLIRKSGAIILMISLIFGSLFAYQGVTGLLGR